MSYFPEAVNAVLSWGADETSPPPYGASPLPWTTIPQRDFAPFGTVDEAVEHATVLRARPGMRWLALYQRFAEVKDGKLDTEAWILTAVESVTHELEEAAR